MALETPNRHVASVNFFFALANELPPLMANDETVIVTALDGCTFRQFPVEGPFTGSIADGFFLELMNPVNSAQATWFASGPPGGALMADPQPLQMGVTPLPQQLAGPSPTVNEWAVTNGNFLAITPDYQAPFGWVGISIHEIPRVTDAETPIPLPPPVP